MRWLPARQLAAAAVGLAYRKRLSRGVGSLLGPGSLCGGWGAINPQPAPIGKSTARERAWALLNLVTCEGIPQNEVGGLGEAANEVLADGSKVRKRLINQMREGDWGASWEEASSVSCELVAEKCENGAGLTRERKKGGRGAGSRLLEVLTAANSLGRY